MSPEEPPPPKAPKPAKAGEEGAGGSAPAEKKTAPAASEKPSDGAADKL